jgi:hypothetical protein
VYILVLIKGSESLNSAYSPIGLPPPPSWVPAVVVATINFSTAPLSGAFDPSIGDPVRPWQLA